MAEPDSKTKAELPLFRHNVFYWPDGNIVLVARNVIFRLLKSQLASISTVFGDMFNLSMEQLSVSDPDPSSPQEKYDGVPMIKLDDDPDDLAMLFTLIWKGP